MAWLDAGAFLARVVRLDPRAVVRLQPHGPDAVTLWARLPFAVLVTRGIRADAPTDLLVRATELLEALSSPDVALPAGLPATDWRWPLPALPGRTVERIPAADVLRVDAAAADTVRTASTQGVGGRAVGSRMLRDALLDHVPITVTTDAGDRVAVPQRLVQGAVRMGFVAPDRPVEVRTAGGWTGLAGAHGSAWYRPPLLLR